MTKKERFNACQKKIDNHFDESNDLSPVMCEVNSLAKEFDLSVEEVSSMFGKHLTPKNKIHYPSFWKL
jgi:hypothetical protein